MLDLIFVKVESSSQLLSEIYGICLNTWNERSWHWATPVFMLRFYSSLDWSVWKAGVARHFSACTHFLSWRVRRMTETNLRKQSYTFIHLRAHGHTEILSFSLSIFRSLTHSPSTSTLYAQMAMSVSNFFLLFLFSAQLWRHQWFSMDTLMLTSKTEMTHSLRWSVPCFHGQSYAPHEVAAVSKRSDLFLFYLLPAHTTVPLHNTWQWQTRLASRGNDRRDCVQVA